MQLQHFLVLILTQLVNNEAAFNKNFEEKELWIEQKLDHFNESDTRTWQMRYLASDTFFKPGGPIIINVNGEWPVTFKSEFGSISYEMTELFNGYSVETEHRYYGNSRPVPNLDTENLQYLNIPQALADLAHFIRYHKAMPRFANSKVILLGCSYPGALVVYFMKEYPDLVSGAWSSCAALCFRLDYSDAWVSVGKSLRKIGGDVCYERIANMSKSYREHKKENDAVYSEIKAQGLVKDFNDMDDTFATHVQHRNITMMRKTCHNVSLVENNDLIGFGKLLKLLSSKIPYLGDKNDTEFDENHMERQYLYQSCNELGNFITTSSKHQPFGDARPFTTVVSQCKKEFGPKYTIDYINGKVDELNTKYGGQEPKVDHIYYTKAEDDPWRWTGIIDECATVVPGIGHCNEIRARSEKDTPELAAAKQMGIDLMRSWINGEEIDQKLPAKCYQNK